MLLGFVDHAAMVNAGHYCTTLQHLKEAILRKCSDWFTEKVILLHDNALHTAGTTKQFLGHFRWECLVHPSYNPKLVPSDFHLFTTLRKHFKEKHFCLRLFIPVISKEEG
jgi:hypothetical protein